MCPDWLNILIIALVLGSEETLKFAYFYRHAVQNESTDIILLGIYIKEINN